MAIENIKSSAVVQAMVFTILMKGCLLWGDAENYPF